MYPILFEWGPLKIGTYGVMLAISLFTCWQLLKKRFKEEGLNPDHAESILFYAMIGGVVGSKLYYILFEAFDQFIADPSMVFSGMGLSFFGGLILGGLLPLIVIRKHKLPLLKVTDLMAPLVALGYGIGRIGCQLSGDGCYGVATTLPWGMSYPAGMVPTNEIVHPTPVYETLAGILIYFALRKIQVKKFLPDGGILALFFVLHGFARFSVEFLRLNPEIMFGLSGAQLISMGLMAWGIIWILRLKGKPESEEIKN